VPGLLAFVFGWFAFRSRVTGVYLSIITQAMTYALLLAFFRNDMGFGGNNGLTDFKDILGFNIQAPETRGVLFFASALALALGFLICTRGDRVEIRQGADRGARCREPDALHRLSRRGLQAGRLRPLRHDGGRRRIALRAADRHHQPRRIRPGQFDRGGDLGGGRWPRHADRTDRRCAARQFRKTWFTSGALAEYWLFVLGALFVAVTLFLPKGVIGTARQFVERRKEYRKAREAEDARTFAAAAEPQAAE
jgi:urea transport system permease protein